MMKEVYPRHIESEIRQLRRRSENATESPAFNCMSGAPQPRTTCDKEYLRPSFGIRIGGSFKRVTRGLYIVLVIHMVAYIIYLYRPYVLLPGESSTFQQYIEEASRARTRDIAERSRQQHAGDVVYRPDPGRALKQCK